MARRISVFGLHPRFQSVQTTPAPNRKLRARESFLRNSGIFLDSLQVSRTPLENPNTKIFPRAIDGSLLNLPDWQKSVWQVTKIITSSFQQTSFEILLGMY